MPAMIVSTDTPVKPIVAHLKVSGVVMSEMEMRQLANSVKSTIAYKAGVDCYSEDSAESIVVSVECDAAPPADESHEMPEDPSASEKLGPEAIAAMTPAEFKAAKAAGKV